MSCPSKLRFASFRSACEPQKDFPFSWFPFLEAGRLQVTFHPATKCEKIRSRPHGRSLTSSSLACCQVLPLGLAGQQVRTSPRETLWRESSDWRALSSLAAMESNGPGSRTINDCVCLPRKSRSCSEMNSKARVQLGREREREL